MTRSEQPTEYLYIKASTPSEWDSCDFAIVQVTDQWLDLLEERLSLLQPFRDRKDFYSLEFWDGPDGYYVHTYGDEDGPDTQLLGEEDREWCFAELDPDELDSFAKPESALTTNQMVVTHYGQGYFTAIGKHTDEQYFTDTFDIQELIGYYRAPEQSLPMRAELGEEDIDADTIQYGVNSAINDCYARIENGADAYSALNWLQKEVDLLFNGLDREMTRGR